MPDLTTGPIVLSSPSGVSAVFQRNGTLTWLSWHDLRVNLYPGTALEAGPANIWVRRRSSDGVSSHALLGPASGSSVCSDGSTMLVTGRTRGLAYTAAFWLGRGEPAWSWRVELTNLSGASVEVDVVHAQDVALAPHDVVRTNELYVAQYLDVTALEHPRAGTVVAVRQNLPQGGRFPWLLLGSLRRGVAFSTDALQLHGLAARAGRLAVALEQRSLPSVRLQHEHTLAAVQDRAVTLGPGERTVTGFFGVLRPDHPAATTDLDLAWVDRARDDLGLDLNSDPSTPPGAPRSVVRTLFDPPILLAAKDLSADQVAQRYGSERQLEEREAGSLLSFFTAPRRHVVLRAKELLVLRPHGHLLRTGGHLVPDPRSLTTTTAMSGVVSSFVTQGHVGVDRFLSTARGYLGLQRAFGQRVFVELGGRWMLLDVPSAYEMEPDRVRWLYHHENGVIEVTTTAPADEHAVTVTARVVEGDPVRFLVAHHVGSSGDDGLVPGRLDVVVDGDDVVVTPGPDSAVGRRHPGGAFVLHLLDGAAGADVSDDGVLFADDTSRDLPFVTVLTRPTRAWGLRITGRLMPQEPPTADDGRPRLHRFWDDLLTTPTLRSPTADAAVARLSHLMPWLVHNALVHYLSPRGIEQYTGGAWGTRDVCQGPVELLLALDRPDVVRRLLPLVYRAQSPDGDWPQAFGLYDDDQDDRHVPSHGDVVLWPVLALGRYLLHAQDPDALDETIPFHTGSGPPAAATLLEHAVRAVGLAGRRVVAGTHLVAYGHGDWNDSLQPADPSMAQHLCSSWTVTLHLQALRTLAAGLRAVGRHDHVAGLLAEADAVAADLRRYLLHDGVLAGYVRFAADGTVHRLIHPDDQETGLSYSLLPMVHAIANDLLTPEQARHHVGLIRRHLLAPDGARLFDRPTPYRGGPMVLFQRAESAAFFGREVGLMYTHAHLRYAEAMARLGDADALVEALDQANPVGVRDTVANARPRQANCYFSSSDACFTDRYEADAHYSRVLDGTVDVEGGWRVYSSGAGILYRLVVERLLGLQRGTQTLVVDPVLPQRMDGLLVTLAVAGVPVDVTYRVGGRGSGPSSVVLDGVAVSGVRLANPYRVGGVAVSMTDVRRLLRPEGSELVVTLP